MGPVLELSPLDCSSTHNSTLHGLFFTENSNDYNFKWGPASPKASLGYRCIMSLMFLLVERPKYPEKTIDLPLFAHKIYHEMLCRKHIDMGRITPRQREHKTLGDRMHIIVYGEIRRNLTWH